MKRLRIRIMTPVWLTALVPGIIHTGASISPASGETEDFTNPVNYTVTAEDRSSQAYMVTVTIFGGQSITGK